jgi:anti-sigma-K factor RskA
VESRGAVTPLRGAERGWWRQPAWYAAAAALVLAVGLAVWNVSLRRDLDQRDTELSAQARTLTDVAAGKVVAFTVTEPNSGMSGVVVRPPNGPATLVLHGLNAPPDKTFQVWALEGNRPVSLGVFTPDASGFKVVTLDNDLHNVDAVAITLEPSPRGSLAPTSAPLLVAPVRDQT